MFQHRSHLLAPLDQVSIGGSSSIPSEDVLFDFWVQLKNAVCQVHWYWTQGQRQHQALKYGVRNHRKAWADWCIHTMQWSSYGSSVTPLEWHWQETRQICLLNMKPLGPQKMFWPLSTVSRMCMPNSIMYFHALGELVYKIPVPSIYALH